jgi:arsenate reductase
MAQAWANALKPDVLEAFSAGTDPHGVNRLAIAAMAEVGIDISGQTSKHMDTLKGTAFDYVVTVCDSAHEACPLFPSPARIVHVGFDDPPALAKGARTDDQAMPHYRRVRDQIRRFVESLPLALANQPTDSLRGQDDRSPKSRAARPHGARMP